MEIKIFDKNGNVIRTNTLTITDGAYGKVINIDGYANYYIEHLLNGWERNPSPILCTDSGMEEYVFTQPLKDFIEAEQVKRINEILQ